MHHLVKTWTETQQMVGCVLWEELLWSGQMHLFPHLFESLLALFGSSCKHTLTLHRTLVYGLLQRLFPAVAVNSLGTVVHLCIVCSCSCASDDHRHRGEKSHLTVLNSLL